MNPNNQRCASIAHRLMPFVGAAAIASLIIGMNPAGAVPPPNPVLECVPIVCAAAYIDVSVQELSAAVDAEASRTARPAIAVLIDRLRAAEQAKLAVTGPGDGPAQDLVRYEIVTAHDALHALLVVYSFDGVISPLGAE